MALLITTLSGCAYLPETPEIYQCQFNGNPRAFYCINNKTKARVKIAADSPRMKAAQCLSADDYRQAADWVQQVKEIAEQRCK